MSDIATWLERIGFGKYAAAFAENDISPDLLPHLTEEHLKELGVSLGDRVRFLKALDSLENAPPGVPDTLPAPERPGGETDPTGDAERRHLTVMFCDLAGSTALSEQLDLEAYRELLGAYQEAARESIESFDGYIARYMGDGLLVYFGYPQAHEDDAERAVRAGLGVVSAVSALDIGIELELSVRVGIATGLVVAGDIVGEGASEERAVLGETPNLAARLQAMAPPNGVLISEATWRIAAGQFEFEPLDPRPVKGLRDPVRAFRVRGIRAVSRFEAATERGFSPFVGRQSEFRLLVERWGQAKEGEGQVVLISGEAGIGKSRILREFRDRVEEASHGLVRYQCLSYGTKTAFLPIIEQLQNAAGFTDGDAAETKLDKLENLLSKSAEDVSRAMPLLAALLAVPNNRYPAPTMSPQKLKLETIAVLVSQIEGLARQGPLIVLVEDAHWVDPSTLETFDVMVDRTQALPVLMVITHRPEFDSSWQSYGHVAHFSLNRLKRSDARVLAERVTGGKALPEAVLDEILEHTEGVPLFIEELTKTIVESGLLTEADGRYVLEGPVPPLAIPSTLQDSLRARLDRLSPVKEVAQAAACIGRTFSTKLLSTVLNRASLEDDLDRLADAGLIFRRGTGENATYVFKHALVQDAAYESQLIARRRQLHGRIARALEDSPETDPTVLARHFSGAGMAEKSAANFLSAGKRALSVSALPEASGELELGLREVESLAPGAVRDRLELDLRVALGAAKMAYHGWPHPSVSAAYEPAFELAERIDDHQALGPILWGLCVHYWCRAEFPETHRWLSLLEDLADRSGNSELSVVRDMTAGCQYFWEAAYERAFAYTTHIRETYDERRHASVSAYTNNEPLTFSLQWAGSLLQWITGYPDRALDLVEETHAQARRIGHPFNTAFALTAGSEALLMRGDAGRVLRHCDEVQVIVDEEALGDFAQHVLVNNWRGRAYTHLGNFEAGYRLTKLATTRWRQAGGKICSALFWGGEAIALAGLGRTEEARELMDAAIRHCRETGDRFMEPEALRVNAELMLAADGSRREAAEGILFESLGIARDHGARSWELRTATTLARLWQREDRRDEALDLLAPVYDWFTEGFDSSDLREAKALLETLS